MVLRVFADPLKPSPRFFDILAMTQEQHPATAPGADRAGRIKLAQSLQRMVSLYRDAMDNGMDLAPWLREACHEADLTLQGVEPLPPLPCFAPEDGTSEHRWRLGPEEAHLPRLEWVGEVLRAIADLGRTASLGDLYPESLVALAAVKVVITDMKKPDEAAAEETDEDAEMAVYRRAWVDRYGSAATDAEMSAGYLGWKLARPVAP